MYRSIALPSLVTLLIGVGMAAGPNHTGAQKAKRAVQPKRAAARQASKPAPAPQAERQETTIGDVKIRYLSLLKGNFDFSTTHLAGRDTIIEVPDKASNSVLVLHADVVDVRSPNKRLASEIDIAGNVHYIVTQKVKVGTEEIQRTLDGTAGHGTFRRDAGRIELTEGVHAKITDPTHFVGPATFRGGRVTVNLEKQSPFRYTIEGDPQTNDLKFTQPPDKNRPGTGPTVVHAYGYQSATLQVGKEVNLNGGQTTLQTVSPETKVTTELKASHIVAIPADGRASARAEATGNVRFFRQQPSNKQSGKTDKALQELHGTAARVVFTTQEKGEEIVKLEGPIHATLTDPDLLAEPATFQGAVGDTLQFNVTTNEFDLNTPNRTATFHVVPLGASKTDANKTDANATNATKPDANKPDASRPDKSTGK